jgi:uncharacterized protein YdeI (YjbR/CyaY-like superfamily)
VEVHLEDRASWRAWLAEHHADHTEVWLVSWKKPTGTPSIPYADAVEEALCFGWVDGIPGTIDADRAKRRFARRKPGSAWTAVNRERVERLQQDGLMAAAGMAAVEGARADGSWDAHDAVEAMAHPADLAAALARRPGAATTFNGLAPYLRRDILEWIGAAKRPDTRVRRIEQTADAAALGQVVRHSRPTRTSM